MKPYGPLKTQTVGGVENIGLYLENVKLKLLPFFILQPNLKYNKVVLFA